MNNLKISPTPQDVREQARMLAPFLDLANHLPIGEDYPVHGEFLERFRQCLAPEARTYLDQFRAEVIEATKDPRHARRGKTTLYHIDEVIRTLAQAMFHCLCADAELGAAIDEGEDIESYGSSFLADEIIDERIDHRGRRTIQRINLLAGLFEVRRHIDPRRVRFCAVQQCRQLFYALRPTSQGCSTKCAALLRKRRSLGNQRPGASLPDANSANATQEHSR